MAEADAEVQHHDHAEMDRIDAEIPYHRQQDWGADGDTMTGIRVASRAWQPRSSKRSRPALFVGSSGAALAIIEKRSPGLHTLNARDVEELYNQQSQGRETTRMASEDPKTFVFGSIETEHGRLVRQASLLEPLTERLLREAGVGRGMRVLDLGCGMGDVSMLAARLVGPTGHVVGVDRDDIVLADASQRAEAAGFKNIRFLHCDVADLPPSKPFDAAVGRFILAFVRDPVAVLKGLCALVRSGGVFAFQEVSLANTLAQTAHLPLRREVWSLIHDTLARGGARTNSELFLYRDFQAAGLPPPALRNELLLGDSPEIRSYLLDLLSTMWPRVGEYETARERLGEFSTLAARLDAELEASNSFAACPGVVNAFARRP
jgi:ubiquinone/menaquinone biosynthesis C-methylase UbiE